jgi:hypothetical protein
MYDHSFINVELAIRRRSITSRIDNVGASFRTFRFTHLGSYTIALTTLAACMCVCASVCGCVCMFLFVHVCMSCRVACVYVWVWLGGGMVRGYV